MVIMIIYADKKFEFMEIFNERNGTLIRTDVDGTDPVMRSFPELLDVGIMGHCNSGEYCKKAGIECYQKGYGVCAPHMSAEHFEMIADQAMGKTFQIALGGAGDPNKHPAFEQILEICRSHKIVPNLTTSGFQITDREIDLIRKYCGAVAVSWYSRIINGHESNFATINSVNRLVSEKCVTNIHFVVSTNTIDEAIVRMEHDLFPSGINAVVFILYKPVGYGVSDKVLNYCDSRLEMFFRLSTKKKHPYHIGFDTCFTPAVLQRVDTVPTVSIDSCEAGTFSMYIDSQMNCYPCSFGIWNADICESMYKQSISDIWFGKTFTEFRERKKTKCISCIHNNLCREGCRLGIGIDLCR